jgi:hypothetical protein
MQEAKAQTVRPDEPAQKAVAKSTAKTDENSLG